MINVALESLGCSKNLVDAEIMLGILKDRGFNYIDDFEEADIIIVNTCGFIESAKEESIDTIINYAGLKESGNLKKLVVTGCLAQRYPDELMEEIPEIDAIVGTGSYQNIEDVLDEINSEHKAKDVGEINFVFDETLPRFITTPRYMAYLKIGEGCSNRCTYCIIPKLRGDYRSRPMEDIINEAHKLAESGVRELVVIAQDTTKYGIDLYGRQRLGDLLEELEKIEGFHWIRVMYMYPETIDEKTIEVISKYDNIASYFDMPIQHSSNKILKLMNRHTTREDILNKINDIRSKIPNATLRTTFIVGFPGETKEDIEDLKDFIKKVEFDRLGVFTYSREEDTPADKLPGHMDQEIMDERKDVIMMIQQDISLKKNREKIGKVYETLIEEKVEDKVYMGRTIFDAEEIDCQVYVHTDDDLEIGEFYDVLINDASEYDLIGGMNYEYESTK